MFTHKKMSWFYLHFLLIFFGISRVCCLSLVSRMKVCTFLWNFPLFQAEVWDLEVLRSNHSSWPINVTDVKEGLITVKGHMQVRVRKNQGKTPRSSTNTLALPIRIHHPQALSSNIWQCLCEKLSMNEWRRGAQYQWATSKMYFQQL